MARKAGWTDLDVRAVDTVRVLAADAVQKTGNGHPGTAMSLAPVAYLLFQNVMAHDPSDPTWLGRDRFVLSCGHSSLTQYIQLYLSGYGLELKDLKALRTWGSLTPGHPEVHHTTRRRDHHRPARLRPRLRGRAWRWPSAASAACSTPRPSPARACSTTTCGCSPPTATSWRALRPRPPRSPATRSSATSPSSTTRTRSPSRTTPTSRSARTSPKRYAAYGWEVVDVDWRRSSEPGRHPGVHRGRRRPPRRAREEPAARATEPTLVRLRTVIAWPAPNGPRHRQVARLGARAPTRSPPPRSCSASTRSKTFEVDKAVLAHAREVTQARQGRPPGVEQAVRRVAQGPARARRRSSTGSSTARLPDGLREGPPDLRDRHREGTGDARGIRQGARRPRRRRCPSSGAARPTSPSPTTRRWPASPRSSPRASRRTSGRAAPTGAPCTSASARTPWG